MIDIEKGIEIKKAQKELNKDLVEFINESQEIFRDVRLDEIMKTSLSCDLNGVELIINKSSRVFDKTTVQSIIRYLNRALCVIE